MKKLAQTLFTLAAFGLSSLLVHAQPAPKILVVDLAKLYDSHYKTEEHVAKLTGDEKKASEELEKLNAEGNTLVEQYKELIEQAKNPALTGEARTKAEAESQKKLEQIQAKQNEVGTFRNNATRSIQQRLKTFMSLMLDEIGKIATEIAKKKGATLLIDKSGPSAIGVSNIIYFDPAYDITDEVMKEINQDRPASPVTAPSAAPASSAAPAARPSASPMITVPGAKK